ncbi:MAG: hypothetical protein LBR23_05955 [Spirochaetaceae bacterium]|jgi:pilus assembly protein FimV|nr:hypothetical protein [Spirochaetaceae bacterium]
MAFDNENNDDLGQSQLDSFGVWVKKPPREADTDLADVFDAGEDISFEDILKDDLEQTPGEAALTEEAPPVDEVTLEEDSPPAEDDAFTGEAPPAEEAAIGEEEPAIGDDAFIEEGPPAEDVTLEEEAPAAEDVSFTGEAPAADEVTLGGEDSAAEDIAFTEEAPPVDEVTLEEEAPAAEDVAFTEEAPPVDEVTLEEASAAGDTAFTEEAPPAEDAAFTGEARSSAATPGRRGKDRPVAELTEANLEEIFSEIDDLRKEIKTLKSNVKDLKSQRHTKKHSAKASSEPQGEEPAGDSVTLSAEEMKDILAGPDFQEEGLTLPEEIDIPKPGDITEEIKSVLLYMDKLLENLPKEKIEEFARSEYYATYKNLFSELGIA